MQLDLGLILLPTIAGHYTFITRQQMNLTYNHMIYLLKLFVVKKYVCCPTEICI
jgi:hypothetical protein